MFSTVRKEGNRTPCTVVLAGAAGGDWYKPGGGRRHHEGELGVDRPQPDPGQLPLPA